MSLNKILTSQQAFIMGAGMSAELEAVEVYAINLNNNIMAYKELLSGKSETSINSTVSILCKITLGYHAGYNILLDMAYDSAHSTGGLLSIENIEQIIAEQPFMFDSKTDVLSDNKSDRLSLGLISQEAIGCAINNKIGDFISHNGRTSSGWMVFNEHDAGAALDQYEELLNSENRNLESAINDTLIADLTKQIRTQALAILRSVQE